MPAAAGSVAAASLARTVVSPDWPGSPGRPTEGRAGEPEELGVVGGSHRDVGEQLGCGVGVLAQPAVPNQRCQQRGRDFVDRVGDGVDVGDEQVAQGGCVVVADQRELDGPGGGLVEEQCAGDGDRQPGGRGERLGASGEGTPRIGGHGLIQEVECVGSERRAEGPAQRNAVGAGVEAEHVDEIGGGVAPPDPGRLAECRPPAGGDQAGDDRAEPRPRWVALEPAECGGGQQPVRLAADAERRQRPARTHERGGVIAGPVAVVGIETGNAEADELGQPVAPCRRPQ